MKRIKVTAMAMALTLAISGITMTGCAGHKEKPEHYTDASAGEKFADVAAVRPMTLIYSGLGLATWIVTLPFSIPAGNADQLGQEWVADPLRYTFMRPVGDMGEDAEPHYVKAKRDQ